MRNRLQNGGPGEFEARDDERIKKGLISLTRWYSTRNALSIIQRLVIQNTNDGINKLPLELGNGIGDISPVPEKPCPSEPLSLFDQDA